MRVWKRYNTTLIAALLGLLAITKAAASDMDTVLLDSCPGLAVWTAAHPHERHHVDRSDHEKEPLYSAELSSELARRAELDQHARAPLSTGQMPKPQELRELATVDADNLRWLKELVARKGFPTMTQVGKRGVLDAWLLVQHADSDPAFQQAILDTLMNQTTHGGVSRADMAMLSDRVRLAQGKAQRYGTQFVRDKGGKLVLQEPVEDLAGMDSRRAHMDLMPLNLYQCILHATYDAPDDEEGRQAPEGSVPAPGRHH